jgi:lysophospholipase L1-like esterase
VPRVLVVAPPPIVEVDTVGGMFGGGAEKSRHLAPLLREAAARTGADFLDAGAHIRSSEIDGIHLDADAHQALAGAIGDVLASR